MRALLLLLPGLLLAKTITLSYINTKPASIAKDYYIWRFLDQNISPKEAQKAFEQISRFNYKVFSRYVKKLDDANISKEVACMWMSAKKLIKQDRLCLLAGMTPYKMTKLTQKEKIFVFKELVRYPIAKELRYLLPKDPIPLLLNNPKMFLRLFLRVGKKYRKEYFNRVYTKEFLLQLARHPSFSRFVTRTLIENLDKIAYSLLLMQPSKLSEKENFSIAFMAMKLDYKNIAKEFFKEAYKKAYYQSHKDRASFWLYAITKKQTYLARLLASKDLNIYTIIAHEIAHKDFTNYSTPHLTGKKHINLHNPFVVLEIWQRVQEENLSKLLDEFAYANTQNVYAILYKKLHRYQKHPFITPYEVYLKKIPNDTKALVYAIARQESRFIACAISRSFALGAMQFMPFLAKAFAKRQKIKNFDLDMMFDEKVAIPFALKHIAYLQKKLHHPLLVAYAYNGGIGYTKRKVLPLFQKYPPLLAMELVSYEETREYGKKVLANYYIYKKIFKSPMNLLDILQTLNEQRHTPYVKIPN